jgi:hypothetical protein
MIQFIAIYNNISHVNRKKDQPACSMGLIEAELDREDERNVP